MKRIASFVSVVVFLFAATISQLARADLPDFRELVKETSPAVVNISTVKHSKARQMIQEYGMPDDVPEIFKHFFGAPSPSPRGGQETASLGSGFIISDDGFVLTNNHVIQDADEIIVRLNDRRELTATLVGADPSSDLALLKVDADDLPTLDMGNSDKLEVGEWVVAIGSPFGFDYSVTAGIVSAKGRNLPRENYVPFIQTDVAINPGNSGGPLFNLDGKVVGINSQIYTRSGGFMGVSFAIPINVALDVAEQLKTKGKVSRGWLGVMIQDVNKQLAESFGLDRAAGALVARVMPASPAEEGGLQSGDIITSVDGKNVHLSVDLPHIIGRMKPEQEVKLNVVRNGKRKTIRVTLGNLSEENTVASNSAKIKSNKNRLGILVADLNEQQRQASGGGVVVQKVGDGAARQAGVVRGDIISMIHGKRVRSVREFKKVVRDLPANRNLPMLIVRRGGSIFVPLRISE